MSVGRCKQFLLVAAEACLRNSGPLETSWLFSRMTVMTFCLRRMRPVNLPTRRNRCVSRRGNEEFDPVKCVAALPGQLVLSRCDSNRKGLSLGLCLRSFDGFAIQQNLTGASDDLNRFSFKNGLVGWTQNTTPFGLLGSIRADGRSQKRKEKDKRPSCWGTLDHCCPRQTLAASAVASGGSFLSMSEEESLSAKFARNPHPPPASENAACQLSK
jgi:hypothetical protein